MMWQIINFNILVQQLLATFLRKERKLTLLESFVKPLQTLSDETLYQMQHDGRVIYLEKLLNDYFEIIDYDENDHVNTRQIYIEDAPQIERDYIWLKGEPGVMTIYEDSETPASEDLEWLDVSPEISYQFIIFIPVLILFNETQMRALIDYYKLAGKNYLIETY